VNTGKHRHATQRAARSGLRLGLTAVKGTCLGALASLVVIGGIQTSSPGQTGTASVDDAYERVVQRAVTDHRCSASGFDDASQPASALIRNARGDVRIVSFEKGWDVYNGKRPGNLIAVCLDDRDTAGYQALRVGRRINR
jgi:hypothetical protein